MAPTNKKLASTVAKRRENMQRRLHTLKQQEQKEKDAEAQEKIARLEEALKQKDDELAKLSAQELQAMDVDSNDDGKDEGSDDTGNAGTDDGKEGGSGVTDDSGKGDEEGGKAAGDTEKENEKQKQNEETRSENTQKEKPKEKKKKPAVLESIEKSDNEDDNGLFAKDSEADTDDDIDPYTDSDTDPDTDSDSEYGKALYTFPGAKHRKDAQTVGWTSGRCKGYINMYGKKSAAIYRLETFACPPEYKNKPPADQKVSNPKNRLGEVLDDDGDIKYKDWHLRHIIGVAWRGTGLRPTRDDVDLINPNLVNNWKDVHTYVLVIWKFDGVKEQRWETRSTVRRRWGTAKADMAIYIAALEAESRYIEAKTGKRPAYSRTPSVGLAEDYIRKIRGKTPGSSRSLPIRSMPATKFSKSPRRETRFSESPRRETRSSETPRRETKTLEELREEFLTNYLELLGVENFADLSRAEKRDCIAAWNEEKATHFAAAAAA
ncbi:hypothetical protein DL768_001609 [Monosporascus sp. mg162]|nr:hypothetical protein DL768_001609 [Monosporascus sp. mg162]